MTDADPRELLKDGVAALPGAAAASLVLVERHDRLTWTRPVGSATRYMQFTLPPEETSWAGDLAEQIAGRYGALFGQYGAGSAIDFDARRVGALKPILRIFKAWMVDLASRDQVLSLTLDVE